MAFAIELARKLKGQTSPNPTVGAVVVKDGEIIGMGAHLKAGGPHAEVNALRMAEEKAKGATVYVTLEPCSHFGKTPPCSNLLIEKGVARVVIASTDPNPLVAGQGIKRLENAGIKVEVGLLREGAEALNEEFFHFIKTKQPYVTVKAATSMDGKIATSTGESKWITSEEARMDVHRLRHNHDAILVGIGTILKDNPSLTTRLPEGGKHPLRIILDTHLRTPIDSKVVTDQLAETWIITGRPDEKRVELFRSTGVRIIETGEERPALAPLLQLLGEEHITSLLVEGGGEVNGSFIREGLVDQLILYLAPKVIGGGSESPSPIGGAGFLKMADVMELEFKSFERIGPDIKIVAIPKKENL
ncbi:bifunctional diaminohydroxyphosphoribosylaminopyrimidine deaminase/5-amino-6-(5-phosphoribosylamino)uracil reductase RibD [Pullulanibacillus sp. KACC 23026]|uniref:bifunctional diaminohydroxyphosphoribosylaminopyrimidine deaminase/5-amino-6-(5-phosphoribosylamino)uracil reductase RibD n=1 Tax=Pullulanibacillus sp. KACC 23026 TaxID=3028315 RepID=UPI0023AFFBB9|nr:bifunctional diaminohydroxyphosphoribosylaminopyrimidine deaminase/5-amino-6-(5-phosphoribosylamino)uracil reductase RibD [Pullulanibacillus sp. KACC 23026]WEG12102.1 bifunctional diaminohydroxyphosphoribosylaminopyrimidine deaminase/5-amino-6-(5-phosphoribosylamino)uracil reductase RibD [Pullulanibacillus sp. KACC 23026]